jgi:hypothetical protein
LVCIVDILNVLASDPEHACRSTVSMKLFRTAVRESGDDVGLCV